MLIVFISIYFFTNKLQPMSAEVKARTVIDSVGCEVVILIHPHRVVILNLSNLEIYYATGGAIVTTGAV
ncbi:MAG: ABC transporter substrate-binding protein [Negativicutes bacterium]|nr:ABC transporter substrate-binding protein [Negativicutes bacterium]